MSAQLRIVLTAVAGGLLIVGEPATAAPYLQLNPVVGQPGQVIQATGSPCRFRGHGAEAATVFLDTETDGGYHQYTDIPTGPDGSWSGEVVLGKEAAPGQYHAELWCHEGDQTFGPDDGMEPAKTSFQVVAGTPPTLAASPAEAPPGSRVAVAANGCAAGDAVSVRVSRRGKEVTTAGGAAGEGGTGVVEVTLPPDAVDGYHEINARCTNPSRTLVANLTSILVRRREPAPAPSTSATAPVATTTTTTATTTAEAVSAPTTLSPPAPERAAAFAARPISPGHAQLPGILVVAAAIVLGSAAAATAAALRRGRRRSRRA